MAEDYSYGAPCCQACGHAEHMKASGASTGSIGAPLLVDLDGQGRPVGVRLVLHVRGEDAPRRVPVTKAVMVIGRTKVADIVIPLSVLSRRQCSVEFAADGVFVADLQSACGTYVNGARVGERSRLHEGDTIFIADLTVVVERAAT